MINHKMTLAIALSHLVFGPGCSSDQANPSGQTDNAATHPKTGSGGTPAKPGNQSGSGAGSVAVAPRDPKQKPPADMPMSEIPTNCKGYEVLGLTTSPGGNVLPNTCAPFDGTLNNPYAIRCIDANPDYKTKYTGDEFCILPPADGLGTQVHVGPEDYASPGTFEFAPDSEINTYYYINSLNTESHFYYRANWRMRPGSHHMIITMQDADRADGWAGSAEAGTDVGMGGKSFGGAQRTDVDRPEGTLDIPPENVGIGGELAAKQQFSFNLHHANASTAPILREAWVNIWYMDAKEVTKPLQALSAFGNPADVAIDPGQSAQLEYKCTAASNSRIITMLGHRHVSTDRFGVWVKKASGETIAAYESFDWEDIPTYQYDSVSKNPLPNLASKVDGASSGVLELAAGDELHFECDIHNQQTTRLKFANELYTGEMCILFGSYTGDKPCGGSPERVQH